jgi:hypothetical protein
MRGATGSGNLQLFAPGTDLNAPSLLVGRLPAIPTRLEVINTGTVLRSVFGTNALIGSTIGSDGQLRVTGLRAGADFAGPLHVGYAGLAGR